MVQLVLRSHLGEQALTGVFPTSASQDPRSTDAVFVELPELGHLRVPCADLGRPALSLWEQRQAQRASTEEGRRTIDEGAVFAAIDEQRRLLADAHTTRAARRASARLPIGR